MCGKGSQENLKVFNKIKKKTAWVGTPQNP